MKYLYQFLLLMFTYSSFAADCQTEAQLQNEKTNITQLIKNSQTCTNDQDCKVIYLGCPFGCGTGVNKTKESAVVSTVQNYLSKSCNACKYRCSGKTITTHCINNTCSTE